MEKNLRLLWNMKTEQKRGGEGVPFEDSMLSLDMASLKPTSRLTTL